MTMNDVADGVVETGEEIPAAEPSGAENPAVKPVETPKLVSIKEAMVRLGVSKRSLYDWMVPSTPGWFLAADVEREHARRESERVAHAHRARPVFEEPWHELLVTFTNKGMPENTKANAEQVMLNDEEWVIEGERVAAMNRFTGDVILNREVPTMQGLTPMPGPYPRGLREDDVNQAASWMQSSRYRLKLPAQDLQNAFRNVAGTSGFHPVADYFEWAASRWTQTWCGIDTWMTEFLGVEDSPYAQRAGRYWLLSAVARVLHPGCQADHVLVLEGAQGIGKTTACKVLAVEQEWYLGEIRDMGNKETAMQLRGKLVAEFSELGAMRKSDTEKTKEFLTTSVDKYVPKYSNIEICVPRQCVFAATVNPKTASGGYLSDPTGNRRFWPQKCAVTDSKIDTDGLRTFVNQLWGEAYATHMAQKECEEQECREGGISERCANHRWWPSEDEQWSLFGPQQNARMGEDIWMAPVVKFLIAQASAGKKSTMDEIFVGSLCMAAGDVAMVDQNRMLGILSRFADESHEKIDRTEMRVQKWAMKKEFYAKEV